MPPTYKVTTALKPHQKEGVQWMLARTGGIISDEFGMGKTLQTLAGCLRLYGTLQRPVLIVCTLSLVDHWREQIELHTNIPTRRVHVIGAKQSEPNKKAIFVVATYDKLSYVYRMNRRTLIDSILWGSVVLDEAHEIRSLDSTTTQVIMRINAQTRWCITSTPFCNHFVDVATLCQFLRLEPWSKPDWWTRNCHDAVQLARWRTRCLLVRDKKHILLPPVTTETIRVVFSPEERAFYDRMWNHVREMYLSMRAGQSGRHTGALQHLLVLLLRLRQWCNHPALVMFGVGNANLVANEAVLTVSDQDMDAMQQDDAETSDNESEDADDEEEQEEEDLEVVAGQKRKSPIVAAPVTKRRRLTVATMQERKEAIQQLAPLYKSAKMDALKEYLTTQTHAKEKIIIFSQWTCFLDLIEVLLEEIGFAFLRFDGTVQSPKKRGDLVREFTSNKKIRVFLSSLQSGSMGINLTAAETIIMMDRWFNPFVENHAVNRAHRIGQTKPVKIVRIEVDNSIEQRVESLQKWKTEWSKNILVAGNQRMMSEQDVDRLLRDPVPSFQVLERSVSCGSSDGTKSLGEILRDAAAKRLLQQEQPMHIHADKVHVNI